MRPFSQKKLDSLANPIQLADFSAIVKFDSPDEKLFQFNNIMNTLSDKCCPLIKVKQEQRDHFPWFNASLLAEKKNRGNLCSLLSESRSQENWTAYKDARQGWQKCNRNAIIEFYKKGFTDFKNSEKFGNFTEIRFF